MFNRILYGLADSTLTRVLVAGTLVVVPVGITTAWLGAAYSNAWRGTDFLFVLATLLAYAGLTVFVCGLTLLYAIERFIIRGRAIDSGRWAGLRILLYMAAGVPEGWLSLLSIKWTLGDYPPLVEGLYFIQTIAGSLLVGVLYTLIERAVREVRKRETEFKRQIEELRIEIDEVRQRQQVSEIVDTEAFQELVERARAVRRRRAE